jgi:hypothetical protein
MIEYSHGAESEVCRPKTPYGGWVAHGTQDTAYDSGRGGARWRSISSKAPIPSKGYEESCARVGRNGAKQWHSRYRPSGALSKPSIIPMVATIFSSLLICLIV